MGQAAPWGDEPWRLVCHGADTAIDRLRAGFNTGSRLQTETVNAVAAGDEVLVEQISTMPGSDGLRLD